jgi:hypothetical protein
MAENYIKITYNEQVIASLNAGETATLSCAGQVMESDVVIEAAAASNDCGTGSIQMVTIDVEDIANPTEASPAIARNNNNLYILTEV